MLLAGEHKSVQHRAFFRTWLMYFMCVIPQQMHGMGWLTLSRKYVWVCVCGVGGDGGLYL